MKERYAMNENKVIYSERKTKSMIPLAEILRTGARRLITRAVEVGLPVRMAANASYATDMIQFARSRPGSARSKCKSRRLAILAHRRLESAFASHHQSYENGRGDKRPTSQGRG